MNEKYNEVGVIFGSKLNGFSELSKKGLWRRARRYMTN